MVRHTLTRAGGSDIAAVLLGGSEPGWLAAEAAAIETMPLLAGAPKHEVSCEDLELALMQIAIAANLTHRRLLLDLGGVGAAGGPLWPALEGILDRFEQPPFVVDNPAELLVSERRGRRPGHKRARRSFAGGEGRRSRRTEGHSRRSAGLARHRSAGGPRGLSRTRLRPEARQAGRRTLPAAGRHHHRPIRSRRSPTTSPSPRR